MNMELAQSILAQRRMACAHVDAALCVSGVGGDRQLLGFDDGSVGLPLTYLVPELFGSEAQLQAVARGHEVCFSVPRVNRDDANGQLLYLDFSVLPSLGDGGDGLIFLVEDVSYLAQAEQVLTQQRNELSLLRDRLAAQNLALATANAELRQLDQLKTRFVTIAAHELRSPLATISGYVDLLREVDISGELSDMQQTSVDVIDRSAQRLLNLVSNLLDLTRIEAGRLDLVMEELELVPLVQQVVRELKPAADERGHTLTTTLADDLPFALCDGERVVQVLHNLLGNAIKYTPDGGKVEVTVCRHDDPDYARLCVCDTGIGIPEADQQHLFEAFFRAGNVHRVRAGGSGLGLGIAKSIVELHTGELWVDSSPGQGSRFCFTLPLADRD